MDSGQARRSVFGEGGDRRWLIASSCVALLVLAPLVSLILIAGRGSGDLWPHILAYVLPQALRDTAVLLLGVGVMVVTLGAGLAWLFARQRVMAVRVEKDMAVAQAECRQQLKLFPRVPTE